MAVSCIGGLTKGANIQKRHRPTLDVNAPPNIAVPCGLLFCMLVLEFNPGQIIENLQLSCLRSRTNP